jgi:hypothetical protein
VRIYSSRGAEQGRPPWARCIVPVYSIRGVLELGVRWYTVVYILDVYIGLTPLNCHNQVVNSNYILQHSLGR